MSRLLIDLRRPGIISELTFAAVKLWQKLTSDNIDRLNDAVGTIVAGSVVGPASSTDGHLASFDGTTGTLVQDSGIASTSLVITGTTAGGDLTGTYPNPTVGTNKVTDAKFRQSGALAVVARSANSTGNVADIQAVAASGAVLRESGSALGFGTIATAGIASDAVTDAKLRNSGALSVIGRSANSSGDPADISASAASGAVLRESGSTVGFGTIATAGITDAAVTLAKMANIATDSLIGRDTALTGVPESITLGSSLEFSGSQTIQRAALTGDVTATANSNATTIAANAVSDTKLRDSGALSVIGRSANSSGDPADISASAASGAVLRESGSTVGFGTIATAGIANAAVTLAKMANIATDSLIGRDTALSGVPESITLGASLEFSGSGTIQRAALTGDVTATANSNATTIANDAVTYAKLQNVGALSVVGRSANTSGDAADITGADGNVLRVSGTTLGFGSVAAAAMPALTGDVTTSAGAVATTIANDAVTYAKMQNIAALSVMGRSANTSGDGGDITGADGQVLRVSGTTLGFGSVAAAAMPALTGDVTTSAGAVATTIANDAVTYAKLQNVAALSVVARSANTSGDAGDVTGTDGQILRVSGTTLGFGKILTSQITGTNTNGNATTGDIGEVLGPITRVRSNGNNITPTGTTVNVCTTTSITLTAGDWLVMGSVGFQPAATTSVTSVSFGVTATSATLPGSDTIAVPTSGEVRYDMSYPAGNVPAAEITYAIAPYRVTVANGATLPLFLFGRAAFGASTIKVYGSLEAHRMR